jgi:tripartite-type tricarboxylate transporter receptor subunit TctC
MKSVRAILFGTACIFLAGLVPLPAAAEEPYPTRLITIVVPFPPGGAADSLPRTVGEKVAAKFGQPIIIQHKVGATGNIGAEWVANAQPDGYTLLASPPPPLVINQSLFPQLAFDPARFVPITVIAGAPNVLVANPKLRADSTDELIALAREHPGTLNYASTGSGGTPHLSAEWLKSVAGVQITHVPYKGNPAYTALLAGEVDVMFMNLGDALPYVRSGKLKALAVASERRTPALPGTPTVAETIPGFVSVTWYAVVAPPGTPSAIAEKLSAAFNEALQLPEIARWLAERNFDPIGGSPAQTAAFFKEETQRWSKVIRTANIKAD